MAETKPRKRRTPPKRHTFSIGGQLDPSTFTALEQLKSELQEQQPPRRRRRRRGR